MNSFLFQSYCKCSPTRFLKHFRKFSASYNTGLKESTELSEHRITSFRQSMWDEIEQSDIITAYRVLPNVITDFVELPMARTGVKANKRMQKRLEHILPHGPTFGAVFFSAERWYAKQRRANNELLTNEEDHLHLACLVLWIIETILCNMYVVDDILDCNPIRDNVQCWHTIEEYRDHAINDTHLLTHGAFLLFRKYCQGFPWYSNVSHIFHEGNYGTYAGISQIDHIQIPFKSDNNRANLKDELTAGFKHIYGNFNLGCQVVAAMKMVGQIVGEE